MGYSRFPSIDGFLDLAKIIRIAITEPVVLLVELKASKIRLKLNRVIPDAALCRFPDVMNNLD